MFLSSLLYHLPVFDNILLHESFYLYSNDILKSGLSVKFVWLIENAVIKFESFKTIFSGSMLNSVSMIAVAFYFVRKSAMLL
jgi:hypothetical protein